jgi:hypothetical protein
MGSIATDRHCRQVWLCHSLKPEPDPDPDPDPEGAVAIYIWECNVRSGTLHPSLLSFSAAVRL